MKHAYNLVNEIATKSQETQPNTIYFNLSMDT